MKCPTREPSQPLPGTATETAYLQFIEAVVVPFLRRWSDQQDAGYLLELVVDAVFDERAVAPHSADKAALFAAFVQPFEDEDGGPVIKTPEIANAALSFLVAQKMVTVDGHLVSLHPRFGHGVDASDDSPGLPHANPSPGIPQ